MAAFHPRTFELLREALAGETVTHTLDTARLAKLPEGSQSLMAQQLQERADAFPPVSRDLEWLLAFMQRLTDQDYRHGAKRAAAEQNARAASASPLSHTPLAVAFGAAPAAVTPEPFDEDARGLEWFELHPTELRIQAEDGGAQ
jgi:hypothetical protein